MKFVFICAAAIVSASSANAFDPYAYVRGQFGGTYAESGAVKASTTQTGLTGGYMFTNNFGLESTFGMKNEKFEDAGGTAALNTYIGTVGLRAQTEVGENFVPYAVLSAYTAKSKLDDGVTSISASDSGFAVTGGLDVESKDNLVLGVQATKFVDGPVLYGIHVGYNFKNGLNFTN